VDGSKIIVPSSNRGLIALNRFIQLNPGTIADERELKQEIAIRLGRCTWQLEGNVLTIHLLNDKKKLVLTLFPDLEMASVLASRIGDEALKDILKPFEERAELEANPNTLWNLLPTQTVLYGLGEVIECVVQGLNTAASAASATTRLLTTAAMAVVCPNVPDYYPYQDYLGPEQNPGAVNHPHNH
jgi:hypothetical protein